MQVITSRFSRNTSAAIDIVDITADVMAEVKKSRMKNGQIVVFIGGSTGSITTIEYEPGVIDDLRRTLEQIAPPDATYKHDLAWHDGNGYSHVLAALLGPSRSFPIEGGQIPLGAWQQIVLVDLDNKPRQRTIRVTCMGE